MKTRKILDPRAKNNEGGREWLLSDYRLYIAILIRALEDLPKMEELSNGYPDPSDLDEILSYALELQKIVHSLQTLDQEEQES